MWISKAETRNETCFLLSGQLCSALLCYALLVFSCFCSCCCFLLLVFDWGLCQQLQTNCRECLRRALSWALASTHLLAAFQLITKRVIILHVSAIDKQRIACNAFRNVSCKWYDDVCAQKNAMRKKYWRKQAKCCSCCSFLLRIFCPWRQRRQKRTLCSASGVGVPSCALSLSLSLVLHAQDESWPSEIDDD